MMPVYPQRSPFSDFQPSSGRRVNSCYQDPKRNWIDDTDKQFENFYGHYNYDDGHLYQRITTKGSPHKPFLEATIDNNRNHACSKINLT